MVQRCLELEPSHYDAKVLMQDLDRLVTSEQPEGTVAPRGTVPRWKRGGTHAMGMGDYDDDSDSFGVLGFVFSGFFIFSVQRIS